MSEHPPFASKLLRKIISISYKLLDRVEMRSKHACEGVFRKRLKEELLGMHPLVAGKRVLDVGAGSWEWPREVFGNQCDFITFDIAAHENVDIVGDIYQLNACVSDACPFDVVIATELFEHLTEPTQALEQIFRVLAPGGFIFISTPFNKNLHGEEYGDYWRITRQGWHHLLSTCGFTVKSIRWLGVEHFPKAYFVIAQKPFLQNSKESNYLQE